MELGDEGDALRAMAEQARRHAEELSEGAREQRERAAGQREAEERAVAAARARAPLPGPLLFCPRCNATWTAEAVYEATRRRPGCLLCGRPLGKAPPD
jgi:hypothetical protein